MNHGPILSQKSANSCDGISSPQAAGDPRKAPYHFYDKGQKTDKDRSSWSLQDDMLYWVAKCSRGCVRIRGTRGKPSRRAQRPCPAQGLTNHLTNVA